MPSKTKMKNAAIAAKTAALPKIPKELLDQIAGADAPMTAGQINAATMALKKALIERALGGELSFGTLPLSLRGAAAKPKRHARRQSGRQPIPATCSQPGALQA